MSESYMEKLKDPRWQKKRLEILNRDNWTCQRCHDTETTLHIHHKRYLPGKEPWDIPNDLLITLCEDCHEGEKEGWKEHIGCLADALKENFLSDDLYALAMGFLYLHIEQDPKTTADTLGWALKNPKIMSNLQREYFQYLDEKNKGNQ